MKNIAIPAALSMILSTFSAELPLNWEAWYWAGNDNDFRQNAFPEDLEKFGNQKKVMLEIPETGIDFEQTEAKTFGCVMLRGVIRAEKDETMWLGVGCRIFSLAVNKNVIYDIRWKGLGNDYNPVTAKDHIIQIPLKKGDNEIVISTKRTHFLMDYCYGAERKIEWKLIMKIHRDYQPVKAELAHPELVLRPGSGSFMFSFVTKSPVPAGVDYRVKGTEKWIREWNLAGDQIFREKSRIHKIRINDIPAGKDLEYRIVLLEPPAGLDGMRRAMWTARKYKEVLLPVKTLRNPDRKEFSFFVFGDTQLSISTSCRTVVDRNRYMRRMRSMPEYQNSDFIVHIGDQDSYYHNIEQDLLTNFFDDFSAGNSSVIKPWVFVRGNHETNGLAAEDWFDFFQMPEDKSFYAFRLGDVMFLSLDCGDFGTTDEISSYNGPVIDLNILHERQKKWLEQLRKTAAFRTAKYRIIMCHSEPQIASGRIEDKVREITAPLLREKSPEGRIHFWIAGHVHYYWRAAEGSKTLISRAPRKNPALKISPVNWVSIDGPKGNSSKPDFSYLWVKVSEQGIFVRAIDENGTKLDEFTIDPVGIFQELYRAPELKDFPFSE